MTNLARFTLNGSPSSARGFDGTNSQVITAALEGPSTLIQRWTLEVYSAADTNSPLASKGAPLLALVGATTGQKVDAATPAANVTTTLPASGYHTYKVRSTVNGGLDPRGRPSPDLVFERMIAIRTPSGRRKILASEGTEYEANGWAGAQNDDVDAAVDAPAAATVFRPAVSSSLGQASTNTALIQAAIDEAHSNYLAGNGFPTVVELPTRPIPLAASTSASTWWNYGVSVAATTGCLAMRDGVTLRGAGIGRTVLKPTSPTLDVIHVVDGNDQLIEKIEIDGGWTAAGAGHGILQVTSANNTATPVANLTIRNYYGHDLGSYGAGIENGVFTNVLVENFRTKNTGADGIDIKNRPLPANTSRGIRLENLYIENPGRRLDGQTGVDVRGVAHLSGITVVGVGRAGVEMNGIRFRTYGTDEGWGDRSTLNGFYVKGGDPSFNVSGGVQSGSANVTIGNGVVEDCANGVWLTGNGTAQADDNTCTGVIAINATTRGFYAETAIDHTKWIGCIAVSCLLGFRNEGQNTAIIGCSAPGSTTPRSTSAGALQSEVLVEGNLQQDSLSLTYLTAGRVALEARGASAVIDIALVPKGGGVLRMGTWTANADAAVNGYLTIRDEAGNVRKLATIA